MKRANWVTTLVGVLGMMALGSMPPRAGADEDNRAECAGLPTHAQLRAALDTAVLAETSGLNNHMWSTVVNRDGVVCAVAFSGVNRFCILRRKRLLTSHTRSSQIPISASLPMGHFSNRCVPASGRRVGEPM